MSVSLKALSFAAVMATASLVSISVAAADDIKLSSNQRISCGRGLMAGKLQTSTCRSYAYVFNAKTTEYYRCAATVTVTKDNKDFIQIQTEGGNCQKRERLFPTDSSYSFDAAETEGPNTNSFFGPACGWLRAPPAATHRTSRRSSFRTAAVRLRRFRRGRCWCRSAPRSGCECCAPNWSWSSAWRPAVGRRLRRPRPGIFSGVACPLASSGLTLSPDEVE